MASPVYAGTVRLLCAFFHIRDGVGLLDMVRMRARIFLARRLALAVLFFCVGSPAFATSFFWIPNGRPLPLYLSSDSACKAPNLVPSGKTFVRVALFGDGSNGNCVYSDSDGKNPFNAFGVSRTDKADCEEGKTRDLTTGACTTPAPDPDPPKKCQTPSGGKVTRTSGTGEGPAGAEMASINAKGLPTSSPTCGMTGPPKVERCQSHTEGTKEIFSCTFTGESNGQDSPSSGDVPTDMPVGADDKPGKQIPPFPSPGGGACPEGTTQGGVDQSGIPICMGQGRDPNPPKIPPSTSTTTPGTDSNGNSTSTTSSTKGNADGSSTTTTTTTTIKADGSKGSVTTVTTTNATNGNNGKPDPEQPSLCKQMPELTICKNSTVSGSCATTACTGDAIQCATLRAAAEMNCRERDTLDELKKSSAYTLGQGIAGGNDPIGSTLPTTKNGATVAMPTGLNASGFLGGGSCFGDKQVTVQGKVISLPFSKACDVLIAFRYALMVVAALVSFRIMSGAILGS